MGHPAVDRGARGVKLFGLVLLPLSVLPFLAVRGEVMREHEAYVVRVIIPSRFRLIDQDGVVTTDGVAAALERFRPAGVTICVAYHEDNWVLGQGTVLAQDSQNPNLLLMDGTNLWPTTSN